MCSPSGLSLHSSSRIWTNCCWFVVFWYQKGSVTTVLLVRKGCCVHPEGNMNVWSRPVWTLLRCFHKLPAVWTQPSSPNRQTVRLLQNETFSLWDVLDLSVQKRTEITKDWLNDGLTFRISWGLLRTSGVVLLAEMHSNCFVVWNEWMFHLGGAGLHVVFYIYCDYPDYNLLYE